QQGKAVVPGTGADANGDGVVNNADYLVWKANFGAQQSQLPPTPALSPAVGSGEDRVAAPTGQLAALSQREPTNDSVLQRIAPKAFAFLGEYQEGMARRPGRALVSSNRSLPSAGDAHRLDLALEAWRGFERGAERGSDDSLQERLGASDCTRGSSEDETSLVP